MAKSFSKEQDLQAEMLKILREHGCYAYKTQQNEYTPKGTPDIVACVPVLIEGIPHGLFLSIECKLNPKKYGATRAQQIVGEQIKKAKGIWCVMSDPTQLDDMLQALQGYYGYEPKET